MELCAGFVLRLLSLGLSLQAIGLRNVEKGRPTENFLIAFDAINIISSTVTSNTSTGK